MTSTGSSSKPWAYNCARVGVSRTELLRSYSGLLFRATPVYIPALLRSTFPRCRACSTAERTATNIVIAPIARAAPCSLHLCSLRSLLPAPAPCAPAPCARARAPCSSLLLVLVLVLVLVLPALCSCSHCSLSHSCSLRSQLPSLAAPF